MPGKENKDIVIIDYKAGNAPSVLCALNHIGVSARLVRAPSEASGATHIILPGVGSAGATMDSLREAGFIGLLEREVAGGGTFFLGICVGMQVLFERSEEDEADCLGWIKGEVVRFSPSAGRVPQMGWNEVKFTMPGHPLARGLDGGDYFYFVNSYYARPARREGVVLGETDYGGPFCSAVARGNIAGTQFHAEKSGPAGLRLLENFAAQ